MEPRALHILPPTHNTGVRPSARFNAVRFRLTCGRLFAGTSTQSILMEGNNSTGRPMDQRDKERLLSNLKSLPNELDDLLKNLDEETLRWRPIPNKWSVKE